MQFGGGISDGTEYFCSQNLICLQCLTRKRSKRSAGHSQDVRYRSRATHLAVSVHLRDVAEQISATRCCRSEAVEGFPGR
jgi:hypothetical protein